MLDEINSLNAYQRPNLPLKLEDRYAHTADEATPHGQDKPDKKHFLLQMEYAGPGRAIPEPEDVKTVKIGFLGPIYPTVSVATGGKSHEETLGKRMLQGAELAIEHANARGGYLKRKIPFELVVKNDNGLWGSSGEEIINLSYVDNVWAILGSIDGANTHIAIRVGLKIEIPMMSSGDTDPTFIETNIPWVMRCIGDDRQQSYLLADYLYRKLDFRNVGIVRASNRYGRFGIREIRDTSRRIQRPIPTEMAYRVGRGGFLAAIEPAGGGQGRRRGPLGQRRRWRAVPEPDAGPGHEAAVFRLRPLRVGRLCQDRRPERRGRDLCVSLEPGPPGSQAGRLPRSLPPRSSTRIRRPTRPMPTTA